MKLYVIFILISCPLLARPDDDLYTVLGVRRLASPAEIKRNYKKLARQWHPDKNRSPGANEKFMKINEAYETLSDATKRAKYDQFGETSGRSRQNSGPQFHRMHPFNDFFFNDDPFFGNFHFDSDDAKQQYRVTLRSYDSRIFPESTEHPYVIYAYEDFCFPCMRAEPIWQAFVEDLKVVGMGIGTVNVRSDGNVVNRLRLRSVPSIVVVMNKRLMLFSGAIKVPELREFLRNLFSSDLVHVLAENNYKQFLAGYSDNRMRAVLCSRKHVVPLRLLLAAWKWRARFAVGFANSHDTSFCSSHTSSETSETLLIFNEISTTPVATVSMHMIPSSTIDELLKKNQFLQLPRLSSQRILEILCPEEMSVARRTLCVVLITSSADIHDHPRATFREFATSFHEGNLQFAYIYEDSQSSFVHKLSPLHRHSNLTNLNVAILWRKSRKQISYHFLPGAWTTNADLLLTRKLSLHDLISNVISSKDSLPFTTTVRDLSDEHALKLSTRIWIRLSEYSDRAYDMIYEVDMHTVYLTLCSILAVLLIGYIMKAIADAEEARLHPERHRAPTVTTHTIKELQIYRLSPATFPDLVSKTRPGHITILLLVSEEPGETFNSILKEFAKVVKPFAMSSRLKFAFLSTDRYIAWFRHLLEQVLDTEEIPLNEHQVSGTVLALNGYRNYFYMYHPKYRRSMRHAKGKAEFLGLDDDSNEVLHTEAVLAGLPDWMAVMCDGQLPRMKVESWPALF